MGAMKAFIYNLMLQWKIDIRNKNVLIIYYLVPLFFFFFMGGIFTSINPEMKKTLIPAMIVFSATMGSALSTPSALTEVYGGEIKKSYKTGNIPLWVPLLNNFISAFAHLLIVDIIIFAISPIAFGAAMPENLLMFLLSLIVFLASSISIGTLMGLYIKSQPKIMMLGQIIFLPSILLSGIMFPSDMLPDFLEKISYIFPASLGYRTMTDFNIWFLTALLGITAAAVILSAIKLKRIAQI